MSHRVQLTLSPMAEATALASQLRFGIVVSQLGGELQFSHLPLLVDTEGENIVRLRGHFARANPHWRALAQEPRCTVIFNGAAPGRNHVAVHVNGTMQLLDTPEDTTAIVNDLITVNEAELPSQWDVNGYNPARRAALTPHILGFAVDVTSVEPGFNMDAQT